MAQISPLTCQLLRGAVIVGLLVGDASLTRAEQGSSYSGVTPLSNSAPMPANPPRPAQDRVSPPPALPAGPPSLAGESVTGRDIRVQVTASVTTTMGAPMSGRLVSFPLKDGERFREGQTLARFYCGVQEAAAGRARATLDKKKRILETQDMLRRSGGNSQLEYQMAQAEVIEQQAEVSASNVVLGNCTVSAPFSGRVSGTMAHEHQFVTEGTPLLELVSDRELELELIVPSRWLSWLKTGATFDVQIDETNKSYKAVVARLAGKVDAVSQSIKIYAKVQHGGDDLLVGMSGRALLSPP